MRELKLPMSGDDFTAVIVMRLRSQARHLDVRLVAEFCGVQDYAAQGWFVSTTPLGGIATLKLAYLMREAGLDSPELELFHSERPMSAYIGELLAFDVITMRQALEFCGITDPQGVFRAARGGNVQKFYSTNTQRGLGEFKEANQRLESDRLTAIARLKKKLEAAALDRADASVGQVQPTDSPAQAAPAVVVPEEAPPAPAPALDGEAVVRAIKESGLTDDIAEKVMTQLGSFVPEVPADQGARLLMLRVAQDIKAAEAAAELALSELDAAGRAKLRDLCGDSIFQLSNALVKLSGERAFGLPEEG